MHLCSKKVILSYLPKEEIAFDSDPFTIATVSIDSPFGDDGNISNEHTEIEVVEEFMDEDGRIYFALDDNPIRSITANEGQITHITNYADAYIDILENEAYVLESAEEIEEAYEFFILSKPEQLDEKEPTDYRSWEKASNLERGIIQLTLLVAPALNELGFFIDNDTYSGEDFDKLKGEFEKLGSPNVLIPAPQTVLDIQLYENMQMVHDLWGQIGQFEDPEKHQEEFQALYETLRQEMNNVIIRVNYTLSEDPNNPTE